MTGVKRVRAADRIALRDLMDSGFVIRTRTPIKSVVRCLMLLSAFVAAASLLFYYSSALGAMLAIGTGIIVVFVGRKIEAQEAIQRSTEFMNALFSSALGEGYRFTAVARRSGGIVYVNRPFQDAFPDFMGQSAWDLQSFAAHCGMDEPTRARFLTAAAEGIAVTLCVQAHLAGEQRPQPLAIDMRPISHPRGFMLIRGE